MITLTIGDFVALGVAALTLLLLLDRQSLLRDPQSTPHRANRRKLSA
jgi:hypothetical protein